MKYILYGDESVSNNMIVYAIFACNPTAQLEAESILDKIKTDAIGRNDIPLHARILLHTHQRK